jgi:phosphopantothenoylcysteine decarboxylase/phosphopantothenate--cysteine ligase
VKEGAEVKVVMTPLAKQFITPLTMATLSKNPILVDFFDPENGAWNSHISLGEWADLYLIAPATANTIAKMATGVADNLLLTTYLSARCPVAIAPAMDLDMYVHQTVQTNLDTLRQHGVLVIEPEEGELASGLMGKGRMADIETIITAVSEFRVQSPELAGKRFLVTAGATREAIDPVRFISNHSTGKMGYAIAEALIRRGAEVVLVSGHAEVAIPKGVKYIRINSADEMMEACLAEWDMCNGGIMCAAVADYAPVEISENKLKKTGEITTLTLRRNSDIAAELGKIKGNKTIVGFALETDNERENAIAKMKSKGLDAIVLNSLADNGAGFGCDTNKVTIFTIQGNEIKLPLMSKRETAEKIVDLFSHKGIK